MCLFRLPSCVKRLPQWSHSNFFSPVWVVRWISYFDLNLKCMPQNSHEIFPAWNIRSYRNNYKVHDLFWDKYMYFNFHKGLTAKQALFMCLLRLPSCVNRLLHWVHSNFFWPVCVITCWSNLDLNQKYFPQNEQVNPPLP